MQKQLFILLLFIASLCTLSAQCVQKVVVLEYRGERSKTPLANVEVVVGNAGSQVTNRKGECELSFRSLKPGDKVTVRRIEKEGYEVFNKDAVSQWYISRDGHEFVIVMSESKRIKAQRDTYYNAAEKAFRNNMVKQETIIKQDLNTGAISRTDYEKKVKELENELNEKLENIDNYIDRFAHTDLSSITEEERIVHNMIKFGKIEEAIALYDQSDLIGEYQNQVNDLFRLNSDKDHISKALIQKRDNLSKIYQSVQRQNALLMMAGGAENVEAGFKLLHDVAYADTTYHMPLLEYARYCEKSGRLNEAEEALKYCYDSKDTLTQIRAQLVHTQIEHRKQNYRGMLPSLDSLYNYMTERSGEKMSTSLYLAERAYAIYLLTKSYSFLRDSVSGVAAREKMIEIQQEYTEWNRDERAKRNYVNALYEYYNSEFRLNNRISPQGIQNLEQAIEMQKQLYQSNPSGQAAMLAFLYSAKANYHKSVLAENKNMVEYIDSVKTDYDATIKYYEIAYSKNPRAYCDYVAQNYANIASFYTSYYDNNNYKDLILASLENALKFSNESKNFNILSYRRTYAYIHWFYGRYYLKTKEFSKAEEYFDIAFKIICELYAANKSSYVPTVSSILRDYETLYSPENLNTQNKLQEKIDFVKTNYN